MFSYFTNRCLTVGRMANAAPESPEVPNYFLKLKFSSEKLEIKQFQIKPFKCLKYIFKLFFYRRTLN